MRIWSLHPKHLDRQGLLAAWREALLAQAVLRGRTKGYTKHPQLERFRNHSSPKQAINAYLWHIYQDALARGYNFDSTKVRKPKPIQPISVKKGQVDHECRHLLAKLKKRDPDRYRTTVKIRLALHPIFTQVPGGIESWERID